MSRKFTFVNKNGNPYSPWEKTTLKPFLTESRIKGSNGKEAQKLTVKLYGKGVIAKRDELAGSENTQYFIRKEGQLIYGKLDFLNGAFGIIPPALDGFESTLDSPSFDISGMDPKFLLELISRKDFYLNNGRKANGSRIAKRIHPDDFLAMPIAIPSLAEQQKIAEFFSALDERISLTADKVKLLKEQKKGYLQKVFSRNLIFTDGNGDTYGDWEQKKLKELIVTGKAGGTPTASNKSYYNGTEAIIPFLGISDMTEQGKFLSTTAKKITKDGLDSSSAWIVPTGYLVYAMYASVGKVGITKEMMATSQAMFSMSFGENAATEYVYYYLEHFRDNGLKVLITTGTQGNINAETLKSISIPLPSISEQRKIAEFFSALDEQIELTENKLALLKEQKKGYLQGIFGSAI